MTYLDRLDAVAGRFTALGKALSDGLTDADERTGERWDAGQVWAHTAEFPGYWIGEVQTVVGQWQGEPVPFGRIKSDPGRLEAIERDRATDRAALAQRVHDGIAAVRTLLERLAPAAWDAKGVHQTLGVMDLDRIVEEFLVGHLEEHATQLESLG